MFSIESLGSLRKVKIIECGEPLVDLRTYSPSTYLLIREGIDPLVREEVAERLIKAANSFKNYSYRLLLHRANRSLEEQKTHWDTYYQELAHSHPHWPEAVLRRETNKVFAPYDKPGIPPGHSTGGAVDVYLVALDGTPFDLVPPLDDWSLGATYGAKISSEQQYYRNALYEAMTKEGFSNYPAEYWHYSYGDSAWAVRNGLTESMYGAV